MTVTMNKSLLEGWWLPLLEGIATLVLGLLLLLAPGLNAQKNGRQLIISLFAPGLLGHLLNKPFQVSHFPPQLRQFTGS